MTDARTLRLIEELFGRYGVTTPSVRRLAEVLTEAPEEGIPLSEAAKRCGVSRTAVLRAAKRLSGLWLGSPDYPICEIKRPSIKGRGYETVLICPAREALRENQQPNGSSSKSETLEPDKGNISLRRTEGVASATPSSSAPKKSTFNERESRFQRLNAVDDREILHKGTGLWRIAMEWVRVRCWDLGARREASEVIAGAISQRSVGVPMWYGFRLHQRVLEDEESARILIARVEHALLRGLGAGYAAAHAVLDRLIEGRDPLDYGPAMDGGFDLRTADGCRRFIEAAREIADQGGGRCPRPICGGWIDRDLFEEVWLPFDPFERYEGACSCVYIVFARQAGWKRRPEVRTAMRAAQARRERARRPKRYAFERSYEEKKAMGYYEPDEVIYAGEEPEPVTVTATASEGNSEPPPMSRGFFPGQTVEAVNPSEGSEPLEGSEPRTRAEILAAIAAAHKRGDRETVKRLRSRACEMARMGAWAW